MGKIDYNAIPVCFCKCCLSLALRRLSPDSDFSYCTKCGSTESEEANIKEWEFVYNAFYRRRYLDEENK